MNQNADPQLAGLRRNLRWSLVLLVVGIMGLGTWACLRWLEQSHDQPYAMVEDGLYIGQSVDQPPPGTKAVVNLCGRKDTYPADATLWEPILEGGEEPDLNWLKRIVDFIAAQRKEGRPVFVHCSAGMNRSAAAVVAYLMLEHGWDRDEALRFLQTRRAIAQPNPALMRLLSEWEADLKRRSK